jgi:small-conductance mechanosensitive channel
MSNLSKGVVDEYIRSHQRLNNGQPISLKELTRIKTTLMLLKRSWEVVCGIFCGIGIIMVLPGADGIGAWLYASVSLVGAFVGVTIQPFMRSLFNVILLSTYEPFSLGDELIVDGFRGKVGK